MKDEKLIELTINKISNIYIIIMQDCKPPTKHISLKHKIRVDINQRNSVWHSTHCFIFDQLLIEYYKVKIIINANFRKYNLKIVDSTHTWRITICLWSRRFKTLSYWCHRMFGKIISEVARSQVNIWTFYNYVL